MAETKPLPGRSPWAALHDVHAAAVHPFAGSLRAQVRIPGSKSYTNRALILAAVAHGVSTLRGVLRSDDSYWCIDALRRLGLQVDVQDDTAVVHGGGGKWPAQGGELFIGSAGTIARFLPGVLACTQGQWIVDGTAQLRSRPLATLVDAWKRLGARVECTEEAGALPLRIEGRPLAGGTLSMPGHVSSQFISGVILASPLLTSPLDLRIEGAIVQHAYVLMTLDTMAAFGVKAEHDPGLTHVRVAPQHYQGRTLDLEADASTAGYFLALAAVHRGTVRITNLGSGTRQPDLQLCDVLERMGCAVQRTDAWVEVTGPERLRGGFDVSMKAMSDQTLTVAAIAPFADGPISLREVAHIRHHESDRIGAMCTLLRQLKVPVEEHDDGMTITPAQPVGTTLDTYDDHRVAMALAVLGTRTPGVVLRDPGCVSKTCPTFFSELRALGIGVDLR